MGIGFQFGLCQFDGTVGGAAGRKDGLEALERFVQEDVDAFVDGERTDAADGMADEPFHVAGLDHGRLLVEPFFELMVVHAGITGKKDQDRMVADEERHGLGNAPALRMKGGRRFFDSRTGLVEFHDPVCHPPLGKIVAYFLNRHVAPPLNSL